MKLTHLYIYILCFSSLLVSCKKDKVDRPTYETDETENFLKEEVFYYTKQQSLWETSLPPKKFADINNNSTLRDYTKYYKNAEEVLSSLMALTPIDPSTNKPVDRYSYLDRSGAISNQIQKGIIQSFGMSLTYVAGGTSGNLDLHVQMVDRNSPAGLAGIRRGHRIKSINGNTNLDYNSQQKSNFEFINKALSSSVMTLVVSIADQVDKTIELVNRTYSDNSILKDTIFEQGEKKIGYLAFSSFMNIYTNFGGYTTVHTAFERIFSNFATKNIDELIVDLRYNGGGSPITAEYLADKIIPIEHNRKLMYTNEVNQYLIDQGELLPGGNFAPVYFNKTNNIKLKKVYFLVTNNTASASELLINVLKPYMNVQMIGTYGRSGNKNNTYGKPVGFYEQKIDDGNIKLYATSFKMINAAGFTDYYAGLTPDRHTYEDFSKDFGDPQEGMIAEALYHIANNTYPSNASTGRSVTTKGRSAVSIKSFDQNSTQVKGIFKFSK